MAQIHDAIDEKLRNWVMAQRLFFTATAPLSATGHVNCSPKGLDTLRILGPRTVAYLDLHGSAAETIAHLRENGRMVIMLCAFEGPPRIVRFHGQGALALPGSPAFERLAGSFPPYPGIRSIITLNITRIADSCGYAVPHLRYEEDREDLLTWAEKKGPEGLAAYRRSKNATSLDGLPACP